MADPGSLALAPRLDMQQLFIEAQHRWLRPAEICEILRNYQKFQISAESPNRPPSGSLFIFDRKVLRYFRKDGHNWRKKKDGKTVKEAHEKLKVGSIDVLHCYYAHGEDNENFQRRSYWMLEQELTHIVFVHYLEVKGNRTSSSSLNSFSADHVNEPSGNNDSTSPTSTLSSLYEDADSADSHQKNFMSHSYRSPQIQNSPAMGNSKDGLWRSTQFLNGQSSSLLGTPSPTAADTPGNSSHVTTESGSIGTWLEVFEQCSAGCDGLPSHISTNSNHSVPLSIEGSTTMYLGGVDAEVNSDNSPPLQSNWQFQIPAERDSLHLSDGVVHLSLDPDLAYDWNSGLFEQRAQELSTQNILESFHYSVPDQQIQPLGLENFHMQLASTESQQPTESNFDNDLFEGNGKHTFVMKQSLLSAEEGLKKVDSFSRWVSKELPEVDDLNMRSSSPIAWNTDECDNVIDDSSLSPSLSQDQLFSVIDFSPKWSYLDSETEVHIFGSFLKGHEEIFKCNWSCMFGEVEVPAEVLTDGVLCCRCPHHAAGRVPFYVTNSNRLACSEVREFDYRPGPEDTNASDTHCSKTEFLLHLRLERLLSVRSSCSSNSPFDGAIEKRKIIGRLLSLKEEAENYQMSRAASGENLSCFEVVRRQPVEGQMKEKLFSWLLHKVAESGKGPSILDDDGQGVLHLTAALGLNWAIKPTVAAGVSINFRDVNGWTALHWAAFYGREDTVCVLVSLGAATGALTDPSPEFPLGRPPSDLASQNGHKGISGFLAESSLTNFLKDLTVKEPKEDGVLDVSGTKAVQTIEERTAISVTYNAAQEELSMKDSLSAVRNATQAASRIYQVFRMQSFQRKKLTESEDDEFDISDEHVLSLLSSKTGKSGNAVGVVNAAAIQIQKKYRGWKKRKEFLVIRERIVKIQAHVRGHQVRKQYKPIIWSVGIVEKIILRWRRKGSGLRGFRRDALTKEQSTQALPAPEDAYDVLKEGRKQNEERMQHALTRVKSMIAYPEGRAQYRRLLTVVEGIRESKGSDMVINTPEEVADGDEDLIDFETLLDDDTFMSIAFENP